MFTGNAKYYPNKSLDSERSLQITDNILRSWSFFIVIVISKINFEKDYRIENKSLLFYF